MERTRYYQEAREGTYGGPLFILANLVQSVPVTLTTTFLSAFLIFK